MKAAIYHKYGGPEVIKFAESVSEPVCKSDQIKIKVHAGTVNRTDTGYRSAHYFISRAFTGLFKPRKKVRFLGTDFAGEVIEVGSKVSNFKEGDRVYGFDEKNFGGLSEYKIIGASEMVAHIPASYDYVQAAAIAEGAHYALSSINASDLGKDAKVFVNGATGAIGSAAVQILKAQGAKVDASCRKEHFDIVKEMGASKVVNYKNIEDMQAIGKYDFYCDSVGKQNHKIAKSHLHKNGIYCSSEFGIFPYNPTMALLTKLLPFSYKVIFPIPKNKQADLLYLNELIKNGQFTPLIDKTYLYKDLVEATRYDESGEKVGTVVIEIKS